MWGNTNFAGSLPALLVLRGERELNAASGYKNLSG